MYYEEVKPEYQPIQRCCSSWNAKQARHASHHLCAWQLSCTPGDQISNAAGVVWLDVPASSMQRCDRAATTSRLRSSDRQVDDHRHVAAKRRPLGFANRLRPRMPRRTAFGCIFSRQITDSSYLALSDVLATGRRKRALDQELRIADNSDNSDNNPGSTSCKRRKSCCHPLSPFVTRCHPACVTFGTFVAFIAIVTLVAVITVVAVVTSFGVCALSIALIRRLKIVVASVSDAVIVFFCDIGDNSDNNPISTSCKRRKVVVTCCHLPTPGCCH